MTTYAARRNCVETSRLYIRISTAELAGKLLANKREAIRLRTAMMQVEAVVKMLQPGFNVASIASKRRNKSNPWFKRGTLFRSAVDVTQPRCGRGDSGWREAALRTIKSSPPAIAAVGGRNSATH
jgi:hypothetical protein